MTSLIARARRLGHRAAAQDNDPVNPFDFKERPLEHDTFVDACAVVKANRERGRDPVGHQPPPPHLCARNFAKVCNCCHDCQTVCMMEGAIGVVDSVIERGRGLLKKVFG